MGNCFGTRVISHYSPASSKPISSSVSSKNHSSNKQQNGAPAASKGHIRREQIGVVASARNNDSSSGKAVQVQSLRSIPTNSFNNEGPPPLPLPPSKGTTTGKIITQNLKMFSLSELKSATRNFRPDTVLGEGGFGRVFRGWIDEKTYAPSKVGVGMAVAVKKSNPDSSQGLREWQAEVKFLGKFSHPNLVKLLGYCWEEDQFLLVYEYLQKGSLENHLFRNGAEPLSWEIRLKIAIGAAKGLDFLHTSEKSVIYRDFKTSNILLDLDYNAKLSDFGLAKLGPINGNSHVTTQIMGTYGYAAPEYVATGHLYLKSDVYGFGVVLLELLTGLRALDPSRPSSEHNLVEWAKPFLSEKRKLKKIMDPRLNEQYPIKAAMQIAQLVLPCLESDPKSRPSMKEVLDALIEASAIREKTKESSSRVASHSHSSNRGPEDRSSHRNPHGHHRSPLHSNGTRVHPPSSTRCVRHG